MPTAEGVEAMSDLGVMLCAHGGGDCWAMTKSGMAVTSRRLYSAIVSSVLVLLSPELAGAALTEDPTTYVALDGESVQYADRPDVVRETGAPSVYLSREGREIQPVPRAKAKLGIGPCRPIARPDRPHRSGADVSGHGYWERGTCSGDKATVYNCLYQYSGLDARGRRTWTQKACSSKVTVAPGGGRGKRSTARVQCRSSAVTSWRNHVDVDVHGRWDTADKPFKEARVGCRV